MSIVSGKSGGYITSGKALSYLDITEDASCKNLEVEVTGAAGTTVGIPLYLGASVADNDLLQYDSTNTRYANATVTAVLSGVSSTAHATTWTHDDAAAAVAGNLTYDVVGGTAFVHVPAVTLTDDNDGAPAGSSPITNVTALPAAIRPTAVVTGINGHVDDSTTGIQNLHYSISAAGVISIGVGVSAGPVAADYVPGAQAATFGMLAPFTLIYSLD